MDGNPVPNPTSVEVLSLAVAERVDVIVEMNNPGVWVLGSTLEKRARWGWESYLEYQDNRGSPVWNDPAPVPWDYAQFASHATAPAPEETFVLTFRDIGPQHGSQFDTWTINNKSWPEIEPLTVHVGKRYRIVSKTAAAISTPSISTAIPSK